MSSIVCNKLIPLHDGVIVRDMNFGEQTTTSGIVIRSDDGKSEGIKPRWAMVCAVGQEQTKIKVGDWILIEHGRWTRGVTIKDHTGDEYEVRRVETKSIMMISNDKPNDVYLGQSNQSTTQTFDFTKPMF